MASQPEMRERGLEIPLLGVPLFSLLESAQVSLVLLVSLAEEIQSGGDGVWGEAAFASTGTDPNLYQLIPLSCSSGWLTSLFYVFCAHILFFPAICFETRQLIFPFHVASGDALPDSLTLLEDIHFQYMTAAARNLVKPFN